MVYVVQKVLRVFVCVKVGASVWVFVCVHACHGMGVCVCMCKWFCVFALWKIDKLNIEKSTHEIWGASIGQSERDDCSVCRQKDYVIFSAAQK